MESLQGQCNRIYPCCYQVQNVLWRARDIYLPQAIPFMIIHCGNSYIIHNQSKDIINGIMKIDKTFTKKNSKIKYRQCWNFTTVQEVLYSVNSSLWDEQDTKFGMKDSSLNMFYDASWQLGQEEYDVRSKVLPSTGEVW